MLARVVLVLVASFSAVALTPPHPKRSQEVCTGGWECPTSSSQFTGSLVKQFSPPSGSSVICTYVSKPLWNMKFAECPYLKSYSDASYSQKRCPYDYTGALTAIYISSSGSTYDGYCPSTTNPDGSCPGNDTIGEELPPRGQADGAVWCGCAPSDLVARPFYR
jgi:hypothetical protein